MFPFKFSISVSSKALQYLLSALVLFGLILGMMSSAAMANGLCRAAVTATSKHLSSSKFSHDDSALRDLPNLRAPGVVLGQVLLICDGRPVVR